MNSNKSGYMKKNTISLNIANSTKNMASQIFNLRFENQLDPNWINDK